jgi:N-acetylmuramoyl-L-alanine amidase
MPKAREIIPRLIGFKIRNMATSNIIAFRNKYRAAAIAATKGTKIFPEVVLSAAALESGYSKSGLSSIHNNFFGIKAGSSWKGATVEMKTKEQKPDGTIYTITAKFRKYATPEDSFKDYVKLVSSPRYARAGVLAATTPAEQIKAIKAAGYATDINYPAKVLSVLKSFGNNLFEGITKNPIPSAAILLIVIAMVYYFNIQK